MMAKQICGVVAVGVLGMLVAMNSHAAGGKRSDACAGFTDLAPVRDVETTVLEAQPKGGQCVVRMAAGNDKALLRQRKMIDAVTQIACGAAPQVQPAAQDPLVLEAVLPARCSLPAGKPAFPGSAPSWGRIHNMSFNYPAAAQKERLQGKVMLQLLINAKGSVAAAVLASSSGHAVLDDAALEQTRAWRFDPARPGVVAPPMSVMRSPVDYQLNE